MHNIKTRWIVTGMLFFMPALLKAQNSPKENFSISTQGHFGYIMSHRNNMAHLIKGHIYGGELNYTFKTDGSKPWQQIHRYPEIGLCALHLYLANPEQLGNLEALYPYTNIRLNKLKRKTSLNLRIGVGLAYLTKCFDRIDNHKNNAIGSKLNGFVNLRLNTATMLSPSWRLDTGVGLTHASNGAIKTPNLGLNMATVNIGLGYVFGNKALLLKKDSIPPVIKKWHPMILGVIGIKELEPPEGNKYSAYSLQAHLYRTLNHKNRLGAGIEIFYNNATKKVWTNDSVYTTTTADIIQAGVKAGYSFHIHRLSLPIDFGVYLYKRQAYNGSFFHRIGLRYMITKHVIANVSLLTHWAKADYFEWGFGYEF
ncbi:MAG: acyloxyacyl hydrolase [Bacteroidota bacterium]